MFNKWIEENYGVGGYKVKVDKYYYYNDIEICTLRSDDIFYDLPILKKVDNKIIPVKINSKEGLELLNFINKN